MIQLLLWATYSESHCELVSDSHPYSSEILQEGSGFTATPLTTNHSYGSAQLVLNIIESRKVYHQLKRHTFKWAAYCNDDDVAHMLTYQAKPS